MERFDSRALLAVTAFILVAVAAACGQTGVLRIAGVAPNALLVTLVVLSFFCENLPFYLLLVFFAVLIGRVTPTFFDPVATVTAFLALLVFWLERRLVWPGLIGVVIMVGITTFLTYLFLSPAMLIQHFGILAGELVYNVGVGLLLFEALRLVFGQRAR